MKSWYSGTPLFPIQVNAENWILGFPYPSGQLPGDNELNPPRIWELDNVWSNSNYPAYPEILDNSPWINGEPVTCYDKDAFRVAHLTQTVILSQVKLFVHAVLEVENIDYSTEISGNITIGAKLQINNVALIANLPHLPAPTIYLIPYKLENTVKLPQSKLDVPLTVANSIIQTMASQIARLIPVHQLEANDILLSNNLQNLSFPKILTINSIRHENTVSSLTFNPDLAVDDIFHYLDIITEYELNIENIGHVLGIDNAIATDMLIPESINNNTSIPNIALIQVQNLTVYNSKIALSLDMANVAPRLTILDLSTENELTSPDIFMDRLTLVNSITVQHSIKNINPRIELEVSSIEITYDIRPGIIHEVKIRFMKVLFTPRQPGMRGKVCAPSCSFTPRQPIIKAKAL